MKKKQQQYHLSDLIATLSKHNFDILTSFVSLLQNKDLYVLTVNIVNKDLYVLFVNARYIDGFNHS